MAVLAPTSPCRGGCPGGRARRLWATGVAVMLAALGVWPPQPATCRAADEPDVPMAGERSGGAVDDAADSGGVFLPSDRAKERQLDRARRLVEAGSWTDAAALLDDLLADDRDAFVEPREPTDATRRSIRGEAARLLEEMPRPGRDAYGLLCRGRAERALDDAVARDDSAGIAAVARRWFETPAGRRAAMLAAYEALEADDPLAAASWLARLARSPDASRFEPALSSMREAASRPAGDAAAAAAGEWCQPRGDAARSAVVVASKPLLVPRFRVPVARHPEEARMLERHRRSAPADDFAMPAAMPLAVDGLILTRTPLGVLAVDFESGKRIWLKGTSPAADGPAGGEEAAGELLSTIAFHDATGGCLSSDGRLVFAVDCHPESLAPQAVERRLLRATAPEWRGGNRLVAYDLEDGGRERWRLPAGEGAGQVWFLGAPLVLRDELFVLVEEGGQVRLDVLDAGSGGVRWTQPLAELDDRLTAAAGEAVGRRLAGLMPAVAEGVVVCPLGGGTIVAIDLATRTLAWAHRYRTIGAGMAEAGPAVPRHGDACPVIDGGRVFITPHDSADLICLRLRDGSEQWRHAARGRACLAGASGDRVVVVGPTGVEGLDARSGERRWERGHPAGGRPTGRGLVTRERLFLPLDTPEVVELSLADGAIVSRSAARGGVVPGNLVAYRGEIISRGVDSLDVFHQEEALESRIETASRENPADAWAGYWRAELDLDRGRVAAALAGLARAAQAGPLRLPPGAIADALVDAMRRDFETAAAWWQESRPPGVDVPQVTRVAIDGFLARGDFAAAWQGCRDLLERDAGPSRQAPIIDPSDPAVEVQPDRWLRGRLATLADRGPEAVREEVAAAIRRQVAAASRAEDGGLRVRLLQAVVDRAGALPDAVVARESLAAAIEARADAHGNLPRSWALRRDFLELPVGDVGAAVAGERHVDVDDAWPFGRVEVRRPRSDWQAPGTPGSQIMPLPLQGTVAAAVPGIAVSYDMQQRRLLVTDAFGRRVTEPLPVDPVRSRDGMPWITQASPLEPSVVGRLLFVRSDAGMTAFDIGADAGESRVLWRHARSGDADGGLSIVRAGVGPGGRIARDGAVPLGRRITEPDDLGGPLTVQGAAATAGGVLVHDEGLVKLLDPLSGSVLWERHGLPPVSEWITDDRFACGCTSDGRGSVVLSMHDGRLLHRTAVPHRRQRLATFGRTLVGIVPLDDLGLAERVRLDLVDPADRETLPLGDFAGGARATVADGRHLVVVEPRGRLTVIDLAAGGVSFQADLPGMPAVPRSLRATAWQDRFLVFVGADEGPDLDDDGDHSLLQDMLAAGETTAASAGTVWAVGRADGRLLWPVPATVARHSLHVAQPAGLPVLLFSRQTVQAGRRQVSLVCLDKRTGHAVVDDDRLAVSHNLHVALEMVGRPEERSITIRGVHDTTRPLTLLFTGEPLAPRPPFQAAARPPSARHGIDGLDRAFDHGPAGEAREP